MMKPSRVLLVALGVSFATPLGAQRRAPIRPAIADPACHTVTVTAVRGADPRSIGIRIVNDDPAGFTAQIHAAIGVETEAHGAWHAVGVAGLLVRAGCGATPGECVSLAPRATLDVVPWTGMLGDGQCVCDRCAPAPAGRYRFVVTTCEGCVGEHASYSAPFELPAAR